MKLQFTSHTMVPFKFLFFHLRLCFKMPTINVCINTAVGLTCNEVFSEVVQKAQTDLQTLLHVKSSINFFPALKLLTEIA